MVLRYPGKGESGWLKNLWGNLALAFYLKGIAGPLHPMSINEVTYARQNSLGGAEVGVGGPRGSRSLVGKRRKTG